MFSDRPLTPGRREQTPRTTRFYTDFGLLTCNPEIAADMNEVFKQLTGLGKAGTLKHLWQAPFTLHPSMVAAIQAETEAAKAGRAPGPARLAGGCARRGADHRLRRRGRAVVATAGGERQRGEQGEQGEGATHAPEAMPAGR